jgi:hypothetical protein
MLGGCKTSKGAIRGREWLLRACYYERATFDKLIEETYVLRFTESFYVYSLSLSLSVFLVSGRLSSLRGRNEICHFCPSFNAKLRIRRAHAGACFPPAHTRRSSIDVIFMNSP